MVEAVGSSGFLVCVGLLATVLRSAHEKSPLLLERDRRFTVRLACICLFTPSIKTSAFRWSCTVERTRIRIASTEADKLTPQEKYLDRAVERRSHWKRNLGILVDFLAVLYSWRSDRISVGSGGLFLLGSFLVMDFPRPDGETVSAYLRRPRVLAAQVLRLGAIGCFIYLLLHMK